MTILFAGGDIGGVRCLVPVAAACLESGFDVRLVAHGAVPSEWRGESSRLLPPCDDPASLIERTRPDCLVFSTSLADGYALALARAAAAGGIPTVHILDHWTSYAARMTTDGGSLFHPTIYTLLDDLAYRDAVADGLPEDNLLIVGQPALHDLAARRDWTPPDGDPKVLFIGEPVLRDQGGDDGNPSYRGYTEVDAIDWFTRAATDLGLSLDVHILPHPRQSGDELMSAWHRAGHNVPATLAHAARGRDLFDQVHGLVGMASMLLYEGWIFGLPVLSIQPGRRRPWLQALDGRQSAWLVDRPEQLSPGLSAWSASMRDAAPGLTDAAVESARHHQAPAAIVAAIRSCLGRGPHR